MHSSSTYQRPAIMDEIEDPGIPVDDIASDQNQLKEKAKMEVGTLGVTKLYDFAKCYIVRRRRQSRATWRGLNRPQRCVPSFNGIAALVASPESTAAQRDTH